MPHFYGSKDKKSLWASIVLARIVGKCKGCLL